MAGKSDYFGLGYIVSVILAIIPVTSWILGALTRFSEGKNRCRYPASYSWLEHYLDYRPRADDNQQAYYAIAQHLVHF